MFWCDDTNTGILNITNKRKTDLLLQLTLTNNGATAASTTASATESLNDDDDDDDDDRVSKAASTKRTSEGAQQKSKEDYPYIRYLSEIKDDDDRTSTAASSEIAEASEPEGPRRQQSDINTMEETSSLSDNHCDTTTSPTNNNNTNTRLTSSFSPVIVNINDTNNSPTALTGSSTTTTTTATSTAMMIDNDDNNEDEDEDEDEEEQYEHENNLQILSSNHAAKVKYPPGCPVWYDLDNSSGGGSVIEARSGVVSCVYVDFETGALVYKLTIFTSSSASSDDDNEERGGQRQQQQLFVCQDQLAYAMNCPVLVKIKDIPTTTTTGTTTLENDHNNDEFDKTYEEGIILCPQPSATTRRDDDDLHHDHDVMLHNNKKLSYSVLFTTNNNNDDNNQERIVRVELNVEAERISFRKVVKMNEKYIPMGGVKQMEAKEEIRRNKQSASVKECPLTKEAEEPSPRVEMEQNSLQHQVTNEHHPTGGTRVLDSMEISFQKEVEHDTTATTEEKTEFVEQHETLRRVLHVVRALPNSSKDWSEALFYKKDGSAKNFCIRRPSSERSIDVEDEADAIPNATQDKHDVKQLPNEANDIARVTRDGQGSTCGASKGPEAKNEASKAVEVKNPFSSTSSVYKKNAPDGGKSGVPEEIAMLFITSTRNPESEIPGTSNRQQQPCVDVNLQKSDDVSSLPSKSSLEYCNLFADSKPSKERKEGSHQAPAPHIADSGQPSEVVKAAPQALMTNQPSHPTSVVSGTSTLPRDNRNFGTQAGCIDPPAPSAWGKSFYQTRQQDVSYRLTVPSWVTESTNKNLYHHILGKYDNGEQGYKIRDIKRETGCAVRITGGSPVYLTIKPAPSSSRDGFKFDMTRAREMVEDSLLEFVECGGARARLLYELASSFDDGSSSSHQRESNGAVQQRDPMWNDVVWMQLLNLPEIMYKKKDLLSFKDDLQRRVQRDTIPCSVEVFGQGLGNIKTPIQFCKPFVLICVPRTSSNVNVVDDRSMCLLDDAVELVSKAVKERRRRHARVTSKVQRWAIHFKPTNQKSRSFLRRIRARQ